LNAITIKNRYSIFLMNQLLNRLNDVKRFIKLNIQTTYNFIRIKEKWMKNDISMSLRTVRISNYVFWSRECFRNISDLHKLRVEKIFKRFLCFLFKRHINILLKRKKLYKSRSTRFETIKKTQNVREIQQICFRFRRNRLFKIYCKNKWYSHESRKNRYDKKMSLINDASSYLNFYKICEIL
jgi:hypothetical protein